MCKQPDAEKEQGQEEKGTAGDEMVGWHHQPNGHEFEQTPGVGKGQGRTGSPWGDTEYLKSIPDGRENNNLGNLPSYSPQM